MKDTYIRPCPFCGHEALRTDCIGCGYVQISCAGCGANISIVIRDKNNPGPELEQVLYRWNRRTVNNGIVRKS